MYCKQRGMEFLVYINDILVLGNSEADCRTKATFYRSALKRAGFVEFIDKFQEPRQVGVFLGLMLDCKRSGIFILEAKLKWIMTKLWS